MKKMQSLSQEFDMRLIKRWLSDNEIADIRFRHNAMPENVFDHVENLQQLRDAFAHSEMLRLAGTRWLAQRHHHRQE